MTLSIVDAVYDLMLKVKRIEAAIATEFEE